MLEFDTMIAPLGGVASTLDGIVVHFGVGNFHRAHQSRFIARANRADNARWRIWGVCPRQSVARDRLRRQNWRYHLLLEDGDGAQLEEMRVHDNILVAPENPQAVRDVVAAPRTAMATFTITEKGYAAETARPSAGVFRLLAEGLERRRQAGLGGITLMSCDNLPENGVALRASLLRAVPADSALADWIGRCCAFPSSMVDGIVPWTDNSLRCRLREEFGVEDEWPVRAEPFSQWVVENQFAAGPRPPLEKGGVEIADSVAPYERVKLGMLNGAHSLLAYAGLRRGVRFVRDAIRHLGLAKKTEAYWDEAGLVARPPAALDLRAYRTSLRKRFANPVLAHELEQIAMDGSQKIAVRWLPLLKIRTESGQSSPALCDAVAEWVAFCIWRIVNGEQLDDPLSGELTSAARQGPEQILTAGFGGFFARYPRLASGIVDRARQKISAGPANI